MSLILTTGKSVTTKIEVKEGCPYTFNPTECLRTCIRYEGCEIDARRVKPVFQVAKKVIEHKCPYGIYIDCEHVKSGGICKRRTYGNRAPDNPCTSYIRKVKVKL